MAEKTNAAAEKKLTNGYDPKVVANFLMRADSLQADKDAIDDQAKEDKKIIDEDIEALIGEAKKEAGITKKAFKALLAKRKLDRKAERAGDKLEGDDAESYELLLIALGDLKGTPLGEAAVAGAAA